uniref:SSD domain-containing protein n=1 Tax=Parascaris univalens TaxID=6257 RepID=A0A914ZKH1_PARUN
MIQEIPKKISLIDIRVRSVSCEVNEKAFKEAILCCKVLLHWRWSSSSIGETWEIHTCECTQSGRDRQGGSIPDFQQVWDVLASDVAPFFSAQLSRLLGMSSPTSMKYLAAGVMKAKNIAEREKLSKLQAEKCNDER